MDKYIVKASVNEAFNVDRNWCKKVKLKMTSIPNTFTQIKNGTSSQHWHSMYM